MADSKEGVRRGARLSVERGCARGVTGSGWGRWQEDGSRGGWSARGDKAERMPTRCLMPGRLSERDRLRPRGRVQKRCRAREGSRRVRGGQWRGGSGK
jgi:hypothetical protein